MSVLAGTIITVGGNHVIDRIQSAGLGNVNVPIDIVREVGNSFVVDKVPMEPDFSFQISSMDTTIDLMAWLTGSIGAQASASRPGSGDPTGTGYSWNNVSWVNIASPWKDPFTGSAGTVIAGHLIPAYFPTKLSYSFGTTANAAQTVDLMGGEFYYAKFPPIEEFATGNGATTAFTTASPAITHRVGSGTSTQYTWIFGVIVTGGAFGNQLMIEGADYTVASSSLPGAPATATITFTTAPAAAANIRYCYFTNAVKSYPDTVHTSVVIKPGAVRGRNILPWMWLNSARTYVYGVQTFTLDAVADTTVTRELGSDKIIGRSINSFDVKGIITVQSKDPSAFITFLANATGVAATEVYGYFYQNPMPFGIDIQNPTNPNVLLKTIFIPDAQIQPPGTPAKVNTATDFSFSYESLSGTFTEYKAGILGYGTPGQIEG